MKLFKMFWLSFPWLCMANVDLKTEVEDLTMSSPYETAGAILFAVTGADYKTVSQQNPYYVRVRFSRLAILAETLVDFEDGENHRNLPINLPLASNTFPVVAPEDTISIVRWIKGEQEFWLRIQRSSDEWLRDDEDQLTGPDVDHQAFFVIGIPHDGYAPSELASWGGANLVQPTRVNGFPVKDTIFIDLTESFGQPLEPIQFDVIAFEGVVLDGEHGLYTAAPGELTPSGYGTAVNFTGDSQIGRLVETDGNVGTFPWVSNSALFSTTIELHNPTSQPGKVTIKAFNQGLAVEEAEVEVPALDQLRVSIPDLFPEIQGGFPVRWQSDHSGISSTFVTVNRQHHFGYGSDFRDEDQAREFIFSTTPGLANQASAVVLLNTGDQQTQTTICRWGKGQVLDLQTSSLEPWIPKVLLIQDGSEDSIYVQAEQPVIGQIFEFKESGDFSIRKGRKGGFPVPSKLLTP